MYNQMGFDFGMYINGDVGGTTQWTDEVSEIGYISDVMCTGDEDTIWDCSMSTNSSIPECTHNTAVSLYCVRFS